ncbi:MAG TPA: phage head-tail connector protein [Aquabacterium sp.]|nr:phage head-tail connector protein [Aquabacterium sp.]
MTYTITTPSTVEPLSVAEVKAALAIDSDITDFDSTIGSLIKAAREQAEHETGRVLMPQTLRLSLVDWPDDLVITKAPVRSVVSVQYFDGSTWQTLAAEAYVPWEDGLLWRIDPVASWPSLGSTPGHRVRVNFTAGYEDAASVPHSIKRWMIAQIGSWLKNVEAAGQKLELNPAIATLLDAERLYV